MTKPKVQPKSRFAKNFSDQKNAEAHTLERRAKEYLSLGTSGSYVTQVALVLVLLSGVAALGVFAPGLTIAAREWKRAHKYSSKQLTDASGNLKRGGYLSEISDETGKNRVQLTKKGEEYVKKILFDDISLSEPETWNGKWIFVLFDIPIQFSKAREALRWRLKSLGFYQFQKSVWVYPYPCENEILYVADYFGVRKFVEILSVEHLTNDRDMKKFFNMS